VRDSLANMPEDFAVELENIFPNLTSCDLRSGFASHSTGNGTGAVETLVEYAGPVTRKLISAAGSVIYDSSAPGGSTSIATGKTNARWQTTMFGTAGGNFLFMVNGADAPIYYNGSAFVTPTLSGVTATGIVNVAAHHRRLFFVFNSSLIFGYLPVVSVAGTVATFDIGGLCKKGGYIQAIGSWTRDGGSGPDDLFIAVTSEGECVIYSGNDPGVAASWNLVGVFNIGKPIGRRCLEKAGSDLTVITQDGAISMSTFLPIDQIASSGQAISTNIQNEFLASTRAYSTVFGWQSILYPQGSYSLFNIPLSATESIQYVMNSQTGAWCKFTGQNAACWSLFNGNLYFGAQAGGVIYKADSGFSDNAADIDWKIRPAFSYYGSRGNKKIFSLCRPHFTSSGIPSFAIDLNLDFSNINPTNIPTPTDTASGIWDVSKWDESYWAEEVTSAAWTTVFGIGECASPTIRGGTKTISISFTAYDMIWQTGSSI
tara:strand:- start:671 stop:2128 length:1458 start_codon:yes stop_codon:yes gene_type:complete